MNKLWHDTAWSEYLDPAKAITNSAPSTHRARA